jgi:hypothetical protein
LTEEQQPTLRDVPPYLLPREIAKACDMTRRQAARMLQRAGIMEKIGGIYMVGQSRLHERLPEVWDRVFERVVLEVQNTKPDQSRPN